MSYGPQVLQTIDELVSDPEVQPLMSMPTRATVAAVEVTAYEILALGGEQLLASLGGSGTSALVGSLATEALADLTSAIPLLADTLFAIVSLSEQAYAEQERELAVRQAEAERRRAERAKTWLPVATGPHNQPSPADLFVRATPTAGGWSWELPPDAHATSRDYRRWSYPHWPTWGQPRKPTPGQWLELICETEWPAWLLQMLKLPNRAPHPWLGRYPARMRSLRHAIASMHPFARQMQAVEPADSGRSLWPIYADLATRLMWTPGLVDGAPAESAAVRAEHHITDEPPIGRRSALALYGDGWGWRPGLPTIIESPRLLQRLFDLERSRTAQENREVRRAYPRTFELLRGECAGARSAAVWSVYELVRGWRQYAWPYDADLQARRAAELDVIVQRSAVFAREAADRLGLRRPSAGEMARKAPELALSLESAGVVSPSVARRIVARHRQQRAGSLVGGLAAAGALAASAAAVLRSGS